MLRFKPDKIYYQNTFNQSTTRIKQSCSKFTLDQGFPIKEGRNQLSIVIHSIPIGRLQMRCDTIVGCRLQAVVGCGRFVVPQQAADAFPLRVEGPGKAGGGNRVVALDLGESDCVALGAAITVGESGSRRCGRASLGEFGLYKKQVWHKHLLGESSSCPTTDSKAT